MDKSSFLWILGSIFLLIIIGKFLLDFHETSKENFGKINQSLKYQKRELLVTINLKRLQKKA